MSILKRTLYLKVNSKIVLIILISIVLSFGLYFPFKKPVNTIDKNEKNRMSTLVTMPILYTDGNKIKRKDTNEKVILRGAASDAFRYSKDKYRDLDELLKRLDILSDTGGNLITFWLTPEGIRGKESELDKVIEFANQKGVYVNLAPLTGIALQNSSEVERPVMNRLANEEEGITYNNQTKIEELMSNLAERYKNKTNVIYGVGAEPVMSWRDWELPATKIIEKIRSQNPDSLIFVPGGNVGKDIEWLLPYPDIIYGTEQYLAYDGKKLKALLTTKGYTEKYSWQNPDYLKYPLLITEMGGTIASDFGSQEDLSVIDRMLNDLESRNFSYQMHSIDSYEKWERPDGKVVDISGLGMFDKNGNLTAKGELTLKHLKSSPGTRVIDSL